MNHTDIVQALIMKYRAERYLEIGVSRGVNFRAVHCKYKIGVDPARSSVATHRMKSDEFFANNAELWDLVFIDGLHTAEQMVRDVDNALACLTTNGVIVCHDVNPPSERAQLVPRMSAAWTGDCWKGWIELRQRPGLRMYVVDTDFGCGVISRGRGAVLDVQGPLTYAALDDNRAKWLNLVSVDSWIRDLYGSDQWEAFRQAFPAAHEFQVPPRPVRERLALRLAEQYWNLRWAWYERGSRFRLDSARWLRDGR